MRRGDKCHWPIGLLASVRNSNFGFFTTHSGLDGKVGVCDTIDATACACHVKWIQNRTSHEAELRIHDLIPSTTYCFRIWLPMIEAHRRLLDGN